MYDVIDGSRFANGRMFCDMGPAMADGLTCVLDGTVWTSSGWFDPSPDGVSSFSPGGELIGRIHLPEVVSNLCFGGHLRTRLFITAGQSVYDTYVQTQGLPSLEPQVRLSRPKPPAMSTILAIGAHPDDIEIGCGGTVRKLIQQGWRAVHVCVTSGEAGSSTIDKSVLAATREQEARRAAEVLGSERVVFLGAPDGLTQYSRDQKIAVIDLIREVRPEILFLHASSDSFPDHRVVHELVMNAVAGAAGPWYQESTGEPHRPATILGYEVWHPLSSHELAVDITATVERKMDALRCHRSQIESMHYDEAFLGLARYRGVMSFAGSHAEVFEVLRTPLSLPAGLA
ncbi:1D-myo-inositol 2-acetamido-2-deoxy-alpha-D-glucopyranoside deacetylase [Synechococcus sp. CBW1107]|nr:1D-myo-inositol 2-acetamido-2-deoxy-alpha-D-glucopyranoside deacetylase [Synechococcus sp. CBW1107]